MLRSTSTPQDEQLLLHIGFQETVKLHSINFQTPSNGKTTHSVCMLLALCIVNIATASANTLVVRQNAC
jgi:PITH domain